MKIVGKPRDARGPARALAPALALAAGLGLAFAFALGGSAQEEAKPPGKGIEYWAAEAARDRIAPADEPGKPLTLRKEPALHWSNPVRGTGDGALFLWTDRGRPEAAMCVWGGSSEGKPTIMHESQSLALAPLVARRDDRVTWSPKAGVVPAPIPDAPPPAADAAGRLRQLRALAREFTATFGDPPKRTELRPLTRPLYRYEVGGARPDLIDGALFGFVHTTDPEVLLLIEARPAAPGGPMAWHYAFARMSGYSLRAERKEQEVWRADWAPAATDITSPYHYVADWAETP